MSPSMSRVGAAQLSGIQAIGLLLFRLLLVATRDHPDPIYSLEEAVFLALWSQHEYLDIL